MYILSLLSGDVECTDRSELESVVLRLFGKSATIRRHGAGEAVFRPRSVVVDPDGLHFRTKRAGNVASSVIEID